MKRVIVLWTVMILVSIVIIGCGRSEEEKEKDLVGTYVNKADPDEYFELKEGGEYHYWHERLGYDLTGEWVVKGNELIVSYPTTGPMPPSKIKGDKIIGEDGSVHIKVKKRSSPPPKPASIPGEYIDEQGEVLIINNDGTFKFKGESILEGVWKIDGGKITFYSYVGQQKIPAISLSGEIKGDTLYCNGGLILIRQGEVKEIVEEKTTLSKEISKDSISGEYTIEVIEKDGTIEKNAGITIFREDGKIVLRSPDLEEFVIPDQRWQLKNGIVQIYQGESDENPLVGKVEGDTIIFKMVESALRYVKQSDRSRPPISLTKSLKPEGKPETELEQKTESKTFYDIIKEDEKRSRAEPVDESQFKKLSPKEKAEAERLFEMALTERKIGRLPSMTYKRMVDYCREIIKKYPGSSYAAKAKRMLSDIPEKDRKQYNITDGEIGLSNSENKENLAQQIDTRLKAYSDKNLLPPPHISITLRMTAPDLVEKVENIYLSALDYRFLSLRSLRYAKDFLNDGDISKANKYIEKADRYYKLATATWRDSQAVLDSTYSAAEWMVVYKASRTALGFTATGLGVVASAAFDTATLYTDYLLDKSTMPLEEAKKNLIAKAISNVLLRFTGTSEAVGDIVKHGWGSSRVYPELQKIMGSSEFKDAVLKEFMRLGGDVGDYVAKKTIEEALEQVIRGAGTPSFSKGKRIIESETFPDVTKEDDKKGLRAPTGTKPQFKEPPTGDKAKFFGKPLSNGVTFGDDFSVAIAKIQRYPKKTIIWLAFRKISEDWRPVRKALRLRIIDDRQNKYETRFEINGGIFSLKGEPPDLGNIPSGFTWITWVEISKIPEIAPIAKIEIENFDLDFKKPKLPDLGFEIKPEQLLSLGEEIQMDKHLSFRVGNLLVKDEFPGSFGREKGFDITLPLMVRNDDYNAHSMIKLVIGVLLEDGRFIPPGTRGWEGPEIQALSTENYNIRICIGFEKDLGGVISVPHLLLLYKYPFPIPGYQFYQFVPISPEVKQRCLAIKNSYLLSEKLKAQELNQQSPTQTQKGKKEKTKETKKKIEELVEEAVKSLFKELLRKKR